MFTNAFSIHSDERTQIPHHLLQNPRVFNDILQSQHRRHRNPKTRHLLRDSRIFILGLLHFISLRHLDPQSLPQPILWLNAQRLNGRPERHAHLCLSNTVDPELRLFAFSIFLLLPVVTIRTIGHTPRPPSHRHNLQIGIAPPIILLAMLSLVEYMHTFLLEKTSQRWVSFPIVDYFPLTAHREGERGSFEEDGEELRLEF